MSGKMGAVDLDSIAKKLYGELPEDFTSSRSAEVRGARSAGNRQLAADVAKLRRPTVGAWLANQLARDRQDEVEALLDLGTSMRRAQETGDGPQLRQLTQQRRQMIATLVSEAKGLARTRDQPLSENSMRELESTLEAAVATADGADALRSGRLIAGLSYSGFGSLDLSASLTESSKSTERHQRSSPRSVEKPRARDRLSPASKGRSRPEASTTAARPQRDGDEPRRKHDLAEAEQMVKSAEDVAGAVQREVHDVQTERDALRSEIVSAERHLRETTKRLEEAERRLAETKEAEKIAKKEAARANRQRDKAEAALHRAKSRESGGVRPSAGRQPEAGTC